MTNSELKDLIERFQPVTAADAAFYKHMMDLADWVCINTKSKKGEKDNEEK